MIADALKPITVYHRRKAASKEILDLMNMELDMQQIQDIGERILNKYGFTAPLNFWENINRKDINEQIIYNLL